MAYIDSSLESPLAAVSDAMDDARDDAETIDQEAEEELEAEPGEGLPQAGTRKATLVSWIGDLNLARYIEQQKLDEIGQTVVREFELDDNSRAEWVADGEKAMRFALQKTQPKQFPWPGASNVVYPLITTAAVEFHARTYPAIVQGKKVVKGCVWGPDRGRPALDGQGQPVTQPGPDGQPQPVWLVEPGEKRQRADRIADHMSYQLLTLMPSWEPQTDGAILTMSIAGGFVRKSWYDPIEKRNRSEVVSLMNLVWSRHAPSFEEAPRHTEKLLKYPHEIAENERLGSASDEDEGMWLRLDYGPGGGGTGDGFGYDREVESGSASDPDAPHLFIEQHRRLDLDEDGYAEPYIVTVHLRSAKVVRIVAGYDEDGIECPTIEQGGDEVEDEDYITRIAKDEQYTLYPFMPDPEGGSYPVGWGHLLRSLNSSINTTLNQMFDAGTLQNAGGGFVSDQASMPSGQTLFEVGKFHRVTTKGQAIRDAIFPIEFKGPSPTLFQLLGVLINAGEKAAAMANVLTGDAAIANAPPTTILALIEQGMKVYTAIVKRIFRAEKSELDKLYKLNRKHLKEPQQYEVADEWLEVTPDDYRLGGGVEPIADPTMTTDMQKLGRAQLLLMFKDDAQINQLELKRRVLEAGNIERLDDLFVAPDPVQQQVAQMQLERAKAELGRARAAELKDSTQAYLNLAKARTEAQGPEAQYIEHQLTMLRLQIEAVNASTRAAEVDHRFHDTATRSADAHLDRLSDLSAAGPVGPTSGTREA